MAKKEEMIEEYDIRKAFVCKDGAAFFTYEEAVNHAKFLMGLNTKEVIRGV